MNASQGRHALLRPLILRATLAFWVNKDSDLWINQRFLVNDIMRSSGRPDKDTVRTALDDLVRGGVLLRRQLSARRSVYRQAASFADPTAPGYAREVDELLVDPLSWVTADGTFLRAGREAVADLPRIQPVATFPHHFSKHVWMRAWAHALDLGLLEYVREGLDVVTAAARGAPLDYLCGLRERGELARLASAFPAIRRSPAWRILRPPSGRTPPNTTRPLEDPAPDAAEQCLAMIHVLCGHEHLRLLTAPLPQPRPSHALHERDVHVALDALVRRRLERLAPPRPQDDRAPRAALDDPLLERLEPTIRALAPAVRATMTNHRLAWPGGLLALRSP